MFATANVVHLFSYKFSRLRAGGFAFAVEFIHDGLDHGLLNVRRVRDDEFFGSFECFQAHGFIGKAEGGEVNPAFVAYDFHHIFLLCCGKTPDAGA